MDGLIYLSVVFEGAIILACLIFIALLVSTKLLPAKVNKNGVMLFLTLLFISLFYLLINMQWFEIAKPLIWLFVPSTITLSLFFYRFNSIWLNHSLSADRILTLIPVFIFLLAVVLETLNYFYPTSISVQSARIEFTERTLRFLFPLYSGVLIALNYYKIKFAERNNKEQYADRQLVNLNWSIVSLGFFTLFYLGMIFSELTTPFISELVFNISILTLTLYLGYYQIKVIARYLRGTKEPQEAIDQALERPKSEPEDEKLNGLFNELDTIINDEQLYLKTDLTIHELGVRMELNSKYLSQAINHQGDLNFNKYINQKRIDHARQLIHDENYQNYSLEGIATESGFRSKSTFNTTFKSLVGCTPSDFKKRGLNE